MEPMSIMEKFIMSPTTVPATMDVMDLLKLVMVYTVNTPTTRSVTMKCLMLARFKLTGKCHHIIMVAIQAKKPRKIPFSII
jgi:hypothetical protein